MKRKKKLSNQSKILIGVLGFFSTILLFKKYKNIPMANILNTTKDENFYYNKIDVQYRSQFKIDLENICHSIGIKPIWLLRVMWKESKMDPQARNMYSGKLYAVGLIQFVAKTAKSLGYTLDQIYSMDPIQQLPLVKKYFNPYIGKLNSFEDTYFAVFLPLLIGKPNTYVIPNKYYEGNRGIDLNKDGKITKQEFINWANK